MTVKPISGCFTAKEIIQLNDRLNELGFDLGTALDEAFQKVLTAEFALCDASEIPQDTAGEQQFLCITDGKCTFFDKSEIVKLNETVTVLSYNTTTNEISYTDEAGNTVVITLNSSSISYDATTNTITHTAGDGTVTTMPLPVSSLSFDATSCELTFNDQLADDTTIDLSSLVSEAPTYDATTGDLTFTSPKDPDTVINIGQPYTPEPNCFYVDGDKTKANAANKICDAVGAGKAIAFTDGAGNVQQLLTSYDEGDIETYIQGQGGTNIDLVNWTWEGGDKIAVCCEEEICGHLNPAWVVHNVVNKDNSPTENVHYRVGRAHEIPVSMETFANVPVGYAFGSAWCSQDRIVTAGPPRIIDQVGEAGTITSGTDCCPVVCEPECVEWRILVTDLDRNAILTVLNPGDINSVLPGNVGGLWTQDPLDPNVWTYDIQGNTNANGNFSIYAACDKPIQFSLDLLGGDCVGIQTRINEGRAALVKYVCDPSVNANRISAELPSGATVNPNSVIIP